MDELPQIRQIIRDDLNSVGMIPTGKGIVMVADGDASVFYGLMCEAVFVRLYNDRDLEDIFAYMIGPMQQEEQIAHSFIMTALRTRMVLSGCGGDEKIAFETLMGDKNADEKCVKAIIEACVRTSNEFNIPWSKDYSSLLRELLGDRGSAGGGKCCLVLVIGAVLVVVLVLLYLFVWR